MKKLLLIILLIIISTSAMAEWKYVYFTDETTFYFETTSIRKKENIATMWSLYNHVKPRKLIDFTFLSLKTKHAYDCENESRKVLSSIHYEGYMGEGKIVQITDWADGESTYAAIPPDSAIASLMKVACGIK